jgi:hypothetical protein
MTLKMINRVWRGKWKKCNGISWLRDQESKLYSRSMSPILARTRRGNRAGECLLLGVDRKR